MRSEEGGRPAEERDTEGGEALVALVVPDLLNDLLLPYADGVERESRSDVEDPVAREPTRLDDRVGGVDQRLGRDAAVVGAVAAEPLLSFDERDICPFVARGERSRQASGAASDDGDVEPPLSTDSAQRRSRRTRSMTASAIDGTGAARSSRPTARR
jgi:hypothetical protein